MTAAAKALPSLRELLGVPAIARYGRTGPCWLPWASVSHHCLEKRVAAAAVQAVRSGRRQLAASAPVANIRSMT